MFVQTKISLSKCSLKEPRKTLTAFGKDTVKSQWKAWHQPESTERYFRNSRALNYTDPGYVLKFLQPAPKTLRKKHNL